MKRDTNLSLISRVRGSRTATGYLFILPSLIGFLLFVFLPVVFSLVLGFTKWDLFSGIGGLEFVGLKNYARLLEDELFYVSLGNNLLFSVITAPVSVALALLLAVGLNRSLHGRGLLRGMYFFPYVANIVAVSAVWMMLFNAQSGPINQVLRALGVENPPLWLAAPETVMFGIMSIFIWVQTGYVMVIYLAALQNVPNDLYEAATIDGATPFQKFRYVTLPMISAATFFVVVITVIHSFYVFAPVNILTQGGPGNSSYVLVYYIYLSAFRFYKMGYGSAMAMVLFVIIFGITYFQWRQQKKWVHY